MYSKYYQQELYNIRDLAREFSDMHPAIAPLLSGQSTDPDVERLLEGTAFLTGLLRQKLDDSLPEVIHFLADLVFPHFLRPIPSLTLMRFTPKAGMQESISVPKGTTLRSAGIGEEGAHCLFRSSFPCEVHPLRITRISSSGDRTLSITVQLEITGPSLASWHPASLAFFLGGAYSSASELFMLLTRYLHRIVLRSGDGKYSQTLKPEMLKPAALNRENSLLPYPEKSFNGYRLLQEYFILPHKFLYLELHGFEQWRQRGDAKQFSISFELQDAPNIPLNLNRDSFLLATVPAVNLFSHEAEPILLDHRLDKIRITPAMETGMRPEVYTVDKVIGFSRGAVKKKEYVPEVNFAERRGAGNTYTLLHSVSPVHNRPEVAFRFSYPSEAESLIEETLTVRLTCSNGELPIKIQPGEINLPTADTPELVDFTNLMQPTQPIGPPIGGDLLWQYISHFSLNLFSLSDVESLRRLLRLYIFSHGRDRGRVEANQKRLEGIESYRIQPVNRLVRGIMMRGHRIDMEIRADHFAGIGDFSLFGMVLNEFFSEYAGMNSYTQLNISDSNSGEVFSWPARIGTAPLL